MTASYNKKLSQAERYHKKVKKTLKNTTTFQLFMYRNHYCQYSRKRTNFSPGLSRIIYIDRYYKKKTWSRFSPRLKLVSFLVQAKVNKNIV